MCPTMKCHFSGRTVTRAGTVMKSSKAAHTDVCLQAAAE